MPEMRAISLFILSCLYVARVRALSPQDLAASFGLTATTVFDFPAAPINNSGAGNYILASPTWSTKQITENAQDLTFVADPFPDASPDTVNPNASPSNTSATVLAVNYPQGSYSHATGGVQFDNVFDPTGTAEYQSMIVSYEVAFDQGFQFVLGGKLPGLRGGPDNAGCSGGVQPNGTDCFSVRLMWRTTGTGEAYAYIPTPNDLCFQSNIICNDDGFGVSIDRATISFTPAKWTRMTMLIQLNDPSSANGQLWLYYNDLLAIKMQNLYYRSSLSISNIQGMYFSTFFGGNDSTWATPISQNTYYRNIQLWAGQAPSNATGQQAASFSAAVSAKLVQVALWPLMAAVTVASVIVVL